MANYSTTLNLPTVANHVTQGGSDVWVNPNNILLDDANVASETRTAAFCEKLLGSALGFSDEKAPVTGVEVVVDITAFTLTTALLYLSKDAAALIGTPKQITTTGVQTFGGDGDMWGLTISSSEVADSNFGAGLVAQTGLGTISINYLKVRVWWGTGSVTNKPFTIDWNYYLGKPI